MKLVAWFECRIVLKVKAGPDLVSSVANLLMDNRGALSSEVSSAAIGKA